MKAAPPDLNERIDHVERRLIARDARVRNGLHLVQARLRTGAQPRRWLIPLAAVAAASALWKLLPHAKPARAAPVVHERPGGVARGAPLLAVAMPLLLRLLDHGLRSSFASTAVRRAADRAPRQTP